MRLSCQQLFACVYLCVYLCVCLCRMCCLLLVICETATSIDSETAMRRERDACVHVAYSTLSCRTPAPFSCHHTPHRTAQSTHTPNPLPLACSAAPQDTCVRCMPFITQLIYEACSVNCQGFAARISVICQQL